MGVYTERVLPHLTNLVCGTGELRRWRERTMAGLAGDVVEIGFGSGLNVPLYPAEVERVWAVEPSDVAWRLAEARLAASEVPVERVGLDGESLPLDDASCDAVLSTFTLCTIPDVARAVAEVRRVLRPGGRFHLLEHGASPDPGVATWQRRLEPIQRRVAGGCHLTRDPLALVQAAGFEVDRSEAAYAGGPKPYTWLTSAVAVAPGR